MPITIRRLSHDDWKLYREVRLAALKDAPEAFASTYGDAVRQDEAYWRDAMNLPCWFAFDDDQAVGMVRIADAADGLPHLLSMWVAPGSRGSSAGAQLVEAALDWARQRGHAGVDLQVVTDNLRAQSFYRRCGFEPTGDTFILPDGRPEIAMAIHF